MSKSLCIKRIVKDVSDLEKNNLESHNIFFHTVDDDIYKLKVLIIGTNDTPYQNGFYFFDITIPEDYPFAPPKVKFCTCNNKTRFNPNLYVDGKVCLSLINTWSGPKWTSIMDITTVLLTIQSLLDNNPLHHEPGQEKNNTNTNTLYNDIIKYESLNTLLLKNYMDTEGIFLNFKEDMEKEINKIGKIKLIDYIKDFCSKNNDSMVTMPIYRINTKLSYSTLFQNIKKLN